MRRILLLGALLMLILTPRAKAQPTEDYFFGRADSLTRLMRGDLWSGHAEDEWTMQAAANESESIQVLVCAQGRGLRDVTVELEPLSDPKSGAVIPLKNIEWRKVGWVYCDNKYPWGEPGWFPDPLWLAESFDVEPRSVQPLWVTVKVPPGSPPGRYTGYMKVAPGNAPETQIRLVVDVWDFELPKAPNLRTIFALRNTQLAERILNVTPGPKWEKVVSVDYLIEWCRLFTDYKISPQLYNEGGGSPQTTGGYAYMPFIDCRWNHGRLYVDWQRFDMLYDSIVGGGGNTLCVAYLDGWLTADLTDEKKQAARTAFFTQYLPLAQEHFREKGWLDKAYIYCRDEPMGEMIPGTKEQLRMCRQLAPDITRMVVVQDKQNLYPLPLEGYGERWVIPWGWYNVKKAKAIQARGEETWGYTGVSGVPTPNLMIRDPFTQTRRAGLEAWKTGMDGVLHWGVNFWGERDSPGSQRGMREDQYPDGTLKPSWDNQMMGGGYLSYPGPPIDRPTPVPCIRLANLRDAVEDYDYMCILRGYLEQARAKGLTGRHVNRAESLLGCEGMTDGTRWPSDTAIWFGFRAGIARTIEALRKELGE